jgi:hypothetical protein
VTVAWDAASAHAVNVPTTTTITLPSSQVPSALWTAEVLPYLDSLNRKVGLTPAEGELLFGAMARLHAETPKFSDAEVGEFGAAIKSLFTKLGTAKSLGPLAGGITSVDYEIGVKQLNAALAGITEGAQFERARLIKAVKAVENDQESSLLPPRFARNPTESISTALEVDEVKTLTAAAAGAQEDPGFAAVVDGLAQDGVSSTIPSSASTADELVANATKNPELSVLAKELEPAPGNPFNGLLQLRASGDIDTTVASIEKLDANANTQNAAVTTGALADVRSEIGGTLTPAAVQNDVTHNLNPRLMNNTAAAQLPDEIFMEGNPGAGVSRAATAAAGEAEVIATDAAEQTAAVTSEVAAEVGAEAAAEVGADVAVDLGESAASFVDPAMLLQLATQLPQIITEIVQLIKNEPSFEQEVLSALGSIKEQLSAVSEQVRDGFNHVDETLRGIGTKIEDDTQLLEHVAANGAQLQTDLAEITGKLDQIQATMYRIAESSREETLNTALNTYIGFRQRFGEELPLLEFAKASGTFFTWGDQSSLNAVSEHKGGSTAPNQVEAELAGTEGANALNVNLDYLATYANKAGWLDGQGPLNENVPNPEVWGAGSNAYSQLLFENKTDVTGNVLSSIGELESVGETLPPFMAEITEKGPTYKVMDVDGVRIDTGSSILNHALANYLDKAVARNTASGAEPSLTNRIQAQENAALALQHPAATEESYGHCLPCRLGVAPTTETGNTGEALIDPWGTANQTPAPRLPRFEAASDPEQTNSGGTSKLGEMNLCREGAVSEESNLVAWNGTSEQNKAGLLKLGRGSLHPKPLPEFYANAWHLGLGRVTACYASEAINKGFLFFKEIKTQVNYFWESPRDVVPEEKKLLLRVTITDPLPKAQGCAIISGVDAMREMWVGGGTTSACSSNETTPLQEIYERVTDYVHQDLEQEAREIEKGTKTRFKAETEISGPPGGPSALQTTLNNAECQAAVKNNIEQNECEIQIEPPPRIATEVLGFGDGPRLGEQIDEALTALRRDAYRHITRGGESESLSEEAPADVEAAAVRVNGARALLDDYIELGMPNAMSEDPKLRDFVLGAGGDNLPAAETLGDHLLDNSPGAPNLYSAFAREFEEIEAGKGHDPKEEGNGPAILWPKAFPEITCGFPNPDPSCGSVLELEEHANPVAETIEPSPGNGRLDKRELDRDGILPFAFRRSVEQLAARIHAHLEAGVTASGAEEHAIESSAAQLKVVHELLLTAPVDTQLPDVTGSPVVAGTLHCSSGFWEARPAPTFSYRWSREGTSVGEGPSYVVAPADAGQELACEVTAVNEEGEATATSRSVTIGALTEPGAPSVAIRGASAGSRTATLEGSVNPNGQSVKSCRFTVERLSAGFPSGENKTVPCAAGPGSGTEPVAVTGLALELSPGTEYTFFLTAANKSGTATSGLPGGFTTSVLPGPTVVTGEVTNIKRRAALLHGAVNPNGVAVAKCWAKIQEVVVKQEGGEEKIEPGKEKPLEFSCIQGVGTGHSLTSVLVNARKMHPGTKYTYQFFAESVEGGGGEGAMSTPFGTVAKLKHK